MKYQLIISLLLMISCFSCQKESKKAIVNLDQLREIEKEIQNQITIDCNSDIKKHLCAHKWYFDFNPIDGVLFKAKKKEDTMNYVSFIFLCDGSTVFQNKRFQNNQVNLNQKVFWKIENGLLIFELTYMPSYRSPSNSQHVFEFELNQDNTQLEIKNISKSSYQFSTYFIGTGCEG